MRAKFRRKSIVIVAVVFVFSIFAFLSSQNDEVVQVTDIGFNVIVSGSDDQTKRGNKRVQAVTDSQTARGSTEKACKIPELHQNASEVAHFFTESPVVKCSGEDWGYLDEEGRFQLTEKRKSAVCSYQSIIRLGDFEVDYGASTVLSPGDSFATDFSLVYCSEGPWYWWHSWYGLIGQVAASKKAIERSKSISPPTDWSGLNVYMMGMDSLSQMTFRRKLPKTVKYFEEVMGGVVLNGYNIVGDGTPQAWIPILTGKTEEELPLTRKRFSEASYVDDVYPFIWNNFSNAGYATGYGEDMAYKGTFSYRLKGMRQQPTDHYFRTFMQVSEDMNSELCVGAEPLYKTWYRYSEEFLKKYAKVPSFLSMFLGVYSHDDINLVGTLDDVVFSHLYSLFESGQFDNTLFIMMADHGHRFAELRNTHQGQLEERLPFFSFSLPKKFREGKGKKGWENLLKNKDTLSTPFDIYSTLMDVIHWPTEQQLTKDQDPSKRSLSLFRPIPISRTCEQAGVEPHWCTCMDWENALNGEKGQVRIHRLASAIVETINNETAPERSLCAPLKLEKILEAKRMVPNEGLLKYKNIKDQDGFVADLTGKTQVNLVFYQIKLQTTPGGAIYEVTLRHEVAPNNLYIDLKSISHVNKYGDRPHCIIDKNYFLATYCVCYDKI